jgi:hypothetical protein
VIVLGDVIKYISCNLRFHEPSLKNVFKHFLDKSLQYKRLNIQKNSRHEPCPCNVSVWWRCHAVFLFSGRNMQCFCLVDMPCAVSVWRTCHAMFLFWWTCPSNVSLLVKRLYLRNVFLYQYIVFFPN